MPPLIVSDRAKECQGVLVGYEEELAGDPHHRPNCTTRSFENWSVPVKDEGEGYGESKGQGDGEGKGAQCYTG